MQKVWKWKQQDGELKELLLHNKVMAIHDLTALFLMMSMDDPIFQMSSTSPASSESDVSSTDSEGEKIRHIMKELAKKKKQKKQKKKKRRKRKNKSKEKKEEEDEEATLKKNRRRMEKPRDEEMVQSIDQEEEETGGSKNLLKSKEKKEEEDEEATLKDVKNRRRMEKPREEEMVESISQEEEGTGGSKNLLLADHGNVEEDEVVEIIEVNTKDRDVVEIIEVNTKDRDVDRNEYIAEGAENSEPRTTNKEERRATVEIDKPQRKRRASDITGTKEREADKEIQVDAEVIGNRESEKEEDTDQKGTSTNRRRLSPGKDNEDMNQKEASSTRRRLRPSTSPRRRLSPEKDKGERNQKEASPARRKMSPSTSPRKRLSPEKEKGERNQKEASPARRKLSTSTSPRRRPSPGKEKEDRNQKETSPTRRSPSKYKRRQEREEEDKHPRKRRTPVTPERRTLQIQTTDEDRKFFERRASHEVQPEEEVPTVELTGRDIHRDMTTIRMFMKRSYFSIERVAKNTDTRQKMCSFWNLGNCTVGQTKHTSGSFQVAHFCVACHASANVLLGHPAHRCPNIKLRNLDI